MAVDQMTADLLRENEALRCHRCCTQTEADD